MDYAAILAGGSGTRLWPMSRQSRPKQLLPLVDGRSLLQLSLDRLAAVLPPDRTWIITSRQLADAVRPVATALPPGNIVGEPCPRDTANAVALGCLLLLRIDPEARLGIFTADHVIEPVDRFAAAVRHAFADLDRAPNTIVTFGVKPTRPETGYGYVHRGQPLSPGAFRVQQFVEKPDRARAEHYLSGGDYYWNSGMFVWRADTIINALRRFRPEHLAALERATDAFVSGCIDEAARLYEQLPRISIDYAIMEPASQCADYHVVVRELDCRWLDVGSWPAVAEANARDAAGNYIAGQAALVDASDSIVINEDASRLVAVLGVQDVVVVNSGNATLVVPKSRAGDLKSLLAQVQQTARGRFE